MKYFNKASVKSLREQTERLESYRQPNSPDFTLREVIMVFRDYNPSK